MSDASALGAQIDSVMTGYGSVQRRLGQQSQMIRLAAPLCPATLFSLTSKEASVKIDV